MRILMTTDTVGGVWSFTNQLSSELLARNCHVALISFGRAPSEDQLNSMNSRVTQWGEQFRYFASAAPLEWMDGNERAYSEAAPLVLQVANEMNADLILSSQYCFGALPFDGPKVVVAHSDVLSWAKACRKEALPPSPWMSRYCTLAGDGLAQADAVVAPTHWMLHALREHFRIEGELHVIYNGRSIAHSSTKGTRKAQAVAAGRLWDEAKNLQWLSSVELPMPLVIAGENAQTASEYLRNAANVMMAGRLEEEELFSLFQQSAIYLCASKYEPFGLAPLEAALCGCAVVANDIPSLREVWGDAALFFNGARSLSALLERLSQNESELMAARKHARWRASQFTAARMAEGYLELFRSILSRGVEKYAA